MTPPPAPGTISTASPAAATPAPDRPPTASSAQTRRTPAGGRSRAAAPRGAGSAACLPTECEGGIPAPGELRLPRGAAGGGSRISLKTVAVQTVDAHGSRLLNLESRVAATEKNHLEREKTVVDFGNQLESKCAALGTLIQEYGQLQRRLESMENLLKSGNLWILQLPPGVKVARAPSVVFQRQTTCFCAHEWANLEEQQRELHINELKGNNEPQICLDYAISEHDLLSQLQRGEASCNGDDVASKEASAYSLGIPDPSQLMEKPGSVSALDPRSPPAHGGSRIPLVSAVPRAAPSPPAGGRRSARGGAAAGGAAVPAAKAAAAGVGGAGGAAMAGPEGERAEAPAVAARLLRLEARLARAERQLRAALALRGRLQALERRLETGGGCGGGCGGAPRMSARRGAAGGGRRAARPRPGQGPVSLEDVWVQFSEREWRALRGWQQALHRAVMRSNYHMLLSLELDASRHDTQARSEDGIQPCVQSCVDGDGRADPADSEDSIIHIKQEEELASADQQEGEAGEAPEEPCPAEQAFYEPEASDQPKKGKEVHARELPGVEGEDLPGDPDAGFQTYATDVLSWIKQEEEPRCPEQQDLEKEEVSVEPSTVPDENTKRDPAADCFESTARDSEVPGRPGDQFSKDPSPRVTWDSQWNSEMMETNTAGNSLGDDAQHTRGFGEHLDFFSTQENSAGKKLCTYNKRERNPTQQEHLQPPQGAREGDVSQDLTCERSLNERAFHVLHSQPCAAGEKRGGQGPASASYEGLPMGPQLATPPDCGQNPAGEPGLHEHHGLCGEEQPPAESEESFPAENPLTSPCWDHPQDKAEACSRCQQHLAPRGSPAGQQQSQGRGKSYICSDCGKGFVCHSWLVRHQMTHTGERPYKCSECDKSYRRKDYLLNHLRRHSGERLFQCSLCRKRFVLRRSFMKHQESHLQETHLALASWPCTEIRGAVMHSI
ncbi:uncharacterized protein PRD47_002058 [Ara ararauna]